VSANATAVRCARLQVGVTYCSGAVLIWDHTEEDAVKTATREYTELIAEALQPSAEPPNARHIRMVTLIVWDSNDRLVHHITSGIFDCSHR